MTLPDTRLFLNPELLSEGNRVDLYHDGGEAYPVMLEAIAAAKKTILVEMYTFASDATGMKFAKALIEKAKAGVAVRVMYDSLGSRNASTSMFQSMRAAGALVTPFRPLGWFTLRRRDHRKVVIIDGQIGFLGGINLSDEYASDKEGGGNWRDAQIRIEGPEVTDLVAFFAEVWVEEEDDLLFPEGTPPMAPPLPDGMAVATMVSGTRHNRLLIGQNFLHAVQCAKERIWIANAYFIPSLKFHRALRRASQRGVDVRILAPSVTDIAPVYHASRALWDELLRRKVRIFEYQDRMMHAKTMVIDGMWSTVGSYNFDHLSIARNYEVTAVMLSREFGARMEASFEEDCRHSVEVIREEWRKRSWERKVREWFWYQFRTLL